MNHLESFEQMVHGLRQELDHACADDRKMLIWLRHYKACAHYFNQHVRGSNYSSVLAAVRWLVAQKSAYDRSRAAHMIQRYWIRAYWNPAYRVCQARLRRNFAALTVNTKSAPAPAH